jgi:hypothetical protein
MASKKPPVDLDGVRRALTAQKQSCVAVYECDLCGTLLPMGLFCWYCSITADRLDAEWRKALREVVDSTVGFDSVARLEWQMREADPHKAMP